MRGPRPPSPQEVAWQLAHPGDDLRSGLIITCAISSTLATFFVVLRVWSRKLLYGHLCLEVNDWFCLMAWVCFILGWYCFLANSLQSAEELE